VLGIIAMVTVALGTAVAFSDKLVFQRERADRLYSPASHFFARLVVGLPMNVAVAACLILPSYWWIGLQASPNVFFFFLLTNCVLIFLFDGVVGAVVFVANDITTAFGICAFQICHPFLLVAAIDTNHALVRVGGTAFFVWYRQYV